MRLRLLSSVLSASVDESCKLRRSEDIAAREGAADVASDSVRVTYGTATAPDRPPGATPHESYTCIERTAYYMSPPVSRKLIVE